MKVLIAPDSFKHSMTARIAAERILAGARKVFPEIEAVLVPLSDGGEGFLDCIIQGTSGTYIPVEAHDSLMRPIKTIIGMMPDGKTAVIELAKASGLEQLKANEKNPWIASTYGVGELIKFALGAGCQSIVLGIGGSATNDAGAGMAQALGVSFRDLEGRELLPGGGPLSQLVYVDDSKLDKRLHDVKITIACDVSNPLFGSNGASVVYGPQKGANNEMAYKLDENLKHYNDVLEEKYGRSFGLIPGTGAAGGIATSLLAFTKCTLIPGFEIVRKLKRLDSILPGCNLVITGEGKIDAQTKFGKAPYALASMAKKYNVPVVAFAGILGEKYNELFQDGFSYILPLSDKPIPQEESISKGAELLEQASERFFRDIFPFPAVNSFQPRNNSD